MSYERVVKFSVWMIECKSLADGQFSTAKVQNPRWSSIEIQNVLCYWMLEIYPTDPNVAVFETRNQFNECQANEFILLLPTTKLERSALG